LKDKELSLSTQRYMHTHNKDEFESDMRAVSDNVRVGPNLWKRPAFISNLFVEGRGVEAKSSTDLKGKEEWDSPSRNIELKRAQEGAGAPFSNETKVNGPGTLHHRVAVLELGWKQGAAL
jgi:hypothetical protein